MEVERRIFTLALLCAALSGVGALQVSIPQDVYEFARGDNITLPCSFTPKQGTTLTKDSLVVISWSVEGIEASAKETLILTYYSSLKRTDIKKVYEGRVAVDVDIANGKANMKLYSITLADNKQFECRVQIPGDDEGKPADTARLVVLVAPSPPMCKIEGTAQYGQNINLTCKSEEGSPTPTYKWESRDVRNIPRMPAPRTTDKGGILSLYNISKDTSGFYICTSSNKIRSASCNLTLAVMPPSFMALSSTGKIALAVVCVVVALIILVVIIYCCCCKKKKEKDEGYAMGVHEGEYRDKEPAPNGESRRADGEEDVRSYDDGSVRSPTERRDRYEDRSDYDDRRSDYDDRRSDYSDRRDRYSDRNERYDDDRRYNDDRRYEDDRRYDDDRRDRRYDDDDRYDEPYDDRDRERPPRVPNNKPPRRDYDD